MIDLPEEQEEYWSPMFPGFIPAEWPHRILAFFQTGRIYFQGGFVAPFVDSYENCVYTIFENNLLTFVDSIVSFPFLEDAIADPQGKVLCTKEGEPLAIRIGRKSRTRWIVRISTWDLPLEMESLDLLRRFYTYMGVGTHATPGGVGWSLMRKTWKDNHLPFHSTLNGYADQYIWQHAVGGRCDTFHVGEHFDETLEYDMRSAYLKYYEKHPTGKPGYFKHGYCDGYATYFARCSADISLWIDPPNLGPFPFREEEKPIQYPTLPGIYDTYLWKEQIDVCEGLGIDIEVHEGYGWQAFTQDNNAWATTMYTLVQQAPSDIRPLIKKSYVAAIGRHRMENNYFVLVPESEYKEGDVPVAEGSDFYAYFIHPEREYNSVNCPHWWSYTIALTNNELFRFAYPFAASGQLLATNFDSVMVLPTPEDYERFPEKADSREGPAGSWGWTKLTNVDIVAARSFKSNEKTVLPGVVR